jgi:hypothetical protein
VRHLEQPAHLVAAEDLRQPAALLGGAQLDGRVVRDEVLAAEMAVEGAQARDLALQRGGRRRLAILVAGGEVGDEVREVGVGGDQRVRVGAAQVCSQLLEVRPVGLERVAREAAFELEVGQEVEQEVLERLGRGRDGHGRQSFGTAADHPAGATSLSGAAARQCWSRRSRRR